MSQNLHSPNFAFLAAHDGLLVSLAAYAELYVFDDPNTSILKVRQLVEHLAHNAAVQAGCDISAGDSLLDTIRALIDRQLATDKVAQLFHKIRKWGNAAAHEGKGSRNEALALLRDARDLAVWFHRTLKDPSFNPGPFLPPPNPGEESKAFAIEVDQVRRELSVHANDAKSARESAVAEASRRREAEAKAERAYEDLRVALDLAGESEDRLSTQLKGFEERLAAIESKGERRSASAIEMIVGPAPLAKWPRDLSARNAALITDTERAVRREGRNKRNGTPVTNIAAILCADWGKESRSRSVYVADVAERNVRRIRASRWSFAQVIEEAQRWVHGGPVLATFDAPLGVPESYLAAAAKLPRSGSPTTFMELLKNASTWPRFFEATSNPAHWAVERPFFAVPAGPGTLTAYQEAAGRYGVNLYRDIDKATRAKAMFAKSGIPGSVGSATCALWQELAAQLGTARTFKVWPFEGTLGDLLRTNQIVVGEIYPRAAYGTALLDHPIQERARLTIAKTKVQHRRAAIATLQAADWVRTLDVSFENLAEAEANEDNFDACFTAAALLRCVLENIPFSGSITRAALAEGGMLGTGSVNFSLPERAFGATNLEGRAATRMRNDAGTPSNVRTNIQCPIAGCGKIYANGRLGWDAHVGSPKTHPLWRSDLMNGDERKRQFKTEFPDFFK